MRGGRTCGVGRLSLHFSFTRPPAPACLPSHGLPYTVVGRARLLAHEEVAGLLALCGCVANSADDDAFLRVLALPHLGLGERQGMVVGGRCSAGRVAGLALSQQQQLSPPPRDLCSLPGLHVRGALQDARAAARLHGRPPPTLLECAEVACTQAGLTVGAVTAAAAAAAAAAPAARQRGAAGAAGPPGVQAGGNEAVPPMGAHPAADLLPPDLTLSCIPTLGQLLSLIGELQREAGRLRLRALMRRALRDSGLYGWLLARLEGDDEPGGALPPVPALLPATAAAAAAAAAADEEEEGAADVEEDKLTLPLRELLRQAAAFEAEWRRSAASRGDGGGSPSHAAGEQQQQGGEGGLEALQSFLAALVLDEGAPGGPAAPAAAEEEGEEGARGGGTVTISTIHGAKGLEWPVVFLPTLNERYLPTMPRAARDGAWGEEGEEEGGGDAGAAAVAHYAEERRLMHVAATRARDRLYVSYVQPQPGGGFEWGGEGRCLSHGGPLRDQHTSEPECMPCHPTPRPPFHRGARTERGGAGAHAVLPHPG